MKKIDKIIDWIHEHGSSCGITSSNRWAMYEILNSCPTDSYQGVLDYIDEKRKEQQMPDVNYLNLKEIVKNIWLK